MLLPHFEKEQGFALPPLGMLPLIGGWFEEDAQEVIFLTDRLAEDLPRIRRGTLRS